MSYSNFSKTLALVITVLAFVFFLDFFVLAWTEPSVAPPGDNVLAPLNISSNPQSKSGNLTFPAFYDYNNNSYFLDPSAPVSAILSGSVGIGTTGPATGYKLHVEGGGLRVWDALYVPVGAGTSIYTGDSTYSQTLVYRGPAYFNPASGVNALYIATTGNVGIGTTGDTAYKLDIEGDLRVKGNDIYTSGDTNIRPAGGDVIIHIGTP